MRKFGEESSGCLGRFERGRRIIVMGDMNGKVGSERIGKIVGK